MEDFGIGSIPPYDPYHDEQRLLDSKHKKAPHPKKQAPKDEDEVDISQAAGSEEEADDNLGVKDYYTPADKPDDQE